MLSIRLIVSSVVLSLSVPAFAVQSIDWLAVAPKGKTLKLNNDHARVIEVVLKPGQKDAVHTHPANIAYILTHGKVRVTYEGQKPMDMEGKPGDTLYSDPEGPHTIENIGSKPVKFLVVELKDLPLTDSNKK